MGLIFHLCHQKDWQAARENGAYRAASLLTEGFIHCSRADQILRVANLYFPTQTELVLLTIDPEKLNNELRWEPVEDDQYPHVYGPINLEAIITSQPFQPDADGVFRKSPVI